MHKIKNIPLFLLGLFVIEASCMSFHAMKLPTENWLELTVEDPTLSMLKSNRVNCQLACVKTAECHGYEWNENTLCTLGKVQIPVGGSKYIPEYLPTGGKKVFAKTTVAKRDALTVTHLASLWNNGVHDVPFEEDRVSPLSFPAPFDGNVPIMSTMYNGHFFNCLGDIAGNFELICRYFSFITGEWHTLPGTLNHRHVNGAAAAMGNKIYAFCGKDAGGNPTNFAEVYSFEKGTWEDIPPAPYSVHKNIVVAISDTRLLLVGGRLASDVYTNSNHLYDTSTETYLPVPDRDTGLANGMNMDRQSCALTPNGLSVICAGGWTTLDGSSHKIHQYNIASNTWTTDPNFELEWGGLVSVLSLGQRWFVINDGEAMWEHKEGEDPMWVRSVTEPKRGGNVFYKMDYTELIL